jgi:hypothetical protein
VGYISCCIFTAFSDSLREEQSWLRYLFLRFEYGGVTPGVLSLQEQGARHSAYSPTVVNIEIFSHHHQTKCACVATQFDRESHLMLIIEAVGYEMAEILYAEPKKEMPAPVFEPWPPSTHES